MSSISRHCLPNVGPVTMQMRLRVVSGSGNEPETRPVTSSWRRGDRRGLDGQENLKRCPTSRVARHGDSSIVTTDNTLDGRQTETAPDKLGCEKGIEYFRQCGFIHAAACVSYLKHGVMAGKSRG